MPRCKNCISHETAGSFEFSASLFKLIVCQCGRYHKRSNVESVFSMVKAKFRGHVRSKGDVAMKNEVLAKLLCHNLCCLIMSQFELGIDPVFWGERPAMTEEEKPVVQVVDMVSSVNSPIMPVIEAEVIAAPVYRACAGA
jgi:hypothetical protein